MGLIGLAFSSETINNEPTKKQNLTTFQMDQPFILKGRSWVELQCLIL